MQVARIALQIGKHLVCPPYMKNGAAKVGFENELIKSNLLKHVEKLASIPRFTQNLEGLYQAADYIKAEWESMGLEVKEQKYFGPPGDPNEYKNLIVSFGPRNAPVIVLGAHYDSDTKSQTPGADDNASGIAGILEVSRLLAKEDPKLTKRIDVVAYSTEEWPHCSLKYEDHSKYIPYMGSYIHAKSLKDKGTNVIGAIILEMIGYYSNKNNSQNYPLSMLKLFYPTKADFIGVIGNLSSFDLIQKVKFGLKQNSEIKVRSISIPEGLLPDISRSDHSSYWLNGFSGLMINNTSEYRSPHYHKKTDTPDTLDYDKMTEVVKGVYCTLLSL